MGTEVKDIYYFDSEGKARITDTIEVVRQRATDLGINKIVVFTSDGEGPRELSRVLSGTPIKIIAVSWPYKQKFFGSEKEEPFFLPTSDPHVKEELEQIGVKLVQGSMPFQSIIIPGVRDAKIEGIKAGLSLVSGGLPMCVEAIIMATDAGYVEPGEYVIAMSADTAIVANGVSSTWLFHPDEGMTISEIICKPKIFTVSRNKAEKDEHNNP
ncbi:MAG: hypothetical protein M1598_04745 [Actinobacteria bacterium]|nr:hypothetical protein [Actinomycetota bacterium]